MVIRTGKFIINNFQETGSFWKSLGIPTEVREGLGILHGYDYLRNELIEKIHFSEVSGLCTIQQ